MIGGRGIGPSARAGLAGSRGDPLLASTEITTTYISPTRQSVAHATVLYCGRATCCFTQSRRRVSQFLCGTKPDFLPTRRSIDRWRDDSVLWQSDYDAQRRPGIPAND
jgi:hypothetical protein